MDESKKIILELTLDELKLIDKYVELNDETESVFDKIKYAYPQPKMTFQQEGDYVVVSYNDMTYYRLMGEDATCFSWYKRRGVSANHPMPTLTMITDAETERLLDGLYYNHIEVKKEKEIIIQNLKTSLKELANGDVRPIDDVIEEAKEQQTKSPVEECYKDWWGQYPETGTWDSFDDKRWQGFQAGYEFAYAISTAKEVMEKVQEEQKWDVVRESVKWCEEHPDKDPLDYVKPQTPEQVADGLKEAFREAVKQGVVSSSTKKQTLYELIADWWDEIFVNGNPSGQNIESLVEQIEREWLPKEHDTNSYKWNQCIRMIREKLR